MQEDEAAPVPPELIPDHPLLGLGYAGPVKVRALTRLEGNRSTDHEIEIAEEVPVALVYNRQPHAVMMATPADLEDFAVGFTLTEEIVATPAEIRGVEVVRYAQGIEAQVSIPEDAATRLRSRSREMVGRSGCGVCGVQTIEQVLRPPRTVARLRPVPVEALWRAEAALPQLQTWNRATGSLHAAAWVGLDGTPEIVREDVGRHNALDKVAGALARAGRSTSDGFLMITSRASYELVQKAAVAGVVLLAAVSRPTGLAIRLAEATGLTLVALLRGRTANVYANPDGLDFVP